MIDFCCLSHRSNSKPFSIKLFFRGTGLFLISFFLLLALPEHLEAGNQKVIDADITSPTRKNMQFIKRQHIKSYQVRVKVGDEMFVISVFKKDGKNTQKYIVVHDSEDAAFDAGIRAIKHGGAFIALENHENRQLFSYGKKEGSTSQDPNRMFNKDNPYWPVAQKILILLKPSPKGIVIALHNNKPGGNFRLDTISTWKNITIASHADKDIRSLIWIPGMLPEPGKKIATEIAYYKKKRLNVVYEYVPRNQHGDGSMSVYFAKHGIPYRNIEVQAGIRGNRKSELKSRRKQIRYLNVLRRYHELK
ncbi:hypothetical protein MNBD_BACTEROID07-842 [hydrothermal vent metagenome]|uniref:Uncharacterized protein n=1 Tax=hydrothermal vent metagenome TaxID=652676 RepID=A0A3B0U9Z6_9ZZZZ